MLRQSHRKIIQGEPSLAALVPALMAALAVSPEPVRAQQASDTKPEDRVAAAMASSFEFPTDELLYRKHDSTVANLLDGLTITPAIGLPLTTNTIGGRQSGNLTSGSPAVSLTLRYQPAGYWFAQASFIAYLEPARRARWNPDFTYSFGYDDWHPYTFSLIYSNYASNRFSPSKGEPVSPIDHGTISLGWKAPMPRSLARMFLIDQSQTINCRIGLNATPRFDRNDGTTGSWKSSANIGCRFPIKGKLFFDLNMFVYGHGQQPWDPDFTYSFGLFDYRSNRFSIQYANYSGNRFPGHHRAANSGRFVDGGITISWNHGF